MSKVGETLTEQVVKITSFVDPAPEHDFLIGKIFKSRFLLHHGYGEYSVEVMYKNKFYINTSCRLRFLKSEDHPEYFI